MTNNHLIAQVELRVEENKYVRYQYDRYSDLVRLKTENGTAYAKPKEKAWLESDDWGETGTRVNTEKARELEAYAKIAELPLYEGKSLDKTQGGTVWKMVDRKKKDIGESFTYEQSREKPRVGGVYPRYTFAKYKNDSDGKLLLSHYSGQLRTGDHLTPMEASFVLMMPLPPGSVKFETVPDSHKGGKH